MVKKSRRNSIGLLVTSIILAVLFGAAFVVSFIHTENYKITVELLGLLALISLVLVFNFIGEVDLGFGDKSFAVKKDGQIISITQEEAEQEDKLDKTGSKTLSELREIVKNKLKLDDYECNMALTGNSIISSKPVSFDFYRKSDDNFIKIERAGSSGAALHDRMYVRLSHFYAYRKINKNATFKLVIVGKKEEKLAEAEIRRYFAESENRIFEIECLNIEE